MINYLEKFLLNDKVALITGGTGLLGIEIVKALAIAKAKVIILDIDVDKGKHFEQELQNEGHKVYFEYFDVSDFSSYKKKFTEFQSKYQNIDIWINNAFPRTDDWQDKVEKLNFESWRINVDTHLNSYAWLCREVALIMKEQKSGNIINFGSIYGVVGADFTIYENTDMTSPMAYATIKGGIVNLTRYMASYFGEYNIRVNNLCPGGIFDNQNSTFVKNYENKTPLKRMGKPEEIASAALFLASDASSYITGATIMVDGGWTAI